LKFFFLAPALHFQPHVNENTAAQIKTNKSARKAARDVIAGPATLSPVIHRFLKHLLYALLVVRRWHIVQLAGPRQFQ
jgi:hypothetical protein